MKKLKLTPKKKWKILTKLYFQNNEQELATELNKIENGNITFDKFFIEYLKLVDNDEIIMAVYNKLKDKKEET